MRLENQHVLVLGGSSGIGLGIARECLLQGARVTVASRSPAKLETAARLLADTSRVAVCRLDGTDEAALRSFFERTGTLHHVVVTAVEGYYAPIGELDVSRAERTVASKLRSALLVSKHARFAESGSLLLTSGVAADRPLPGGAVTAAMNGAVESLVLALSLELAPVRVNALSPGWIDTPFWDGFAGASKTAVFEKHAQRLPVGRVGRPEDVAQAAVYLLTNGFTTGEVLHVDGGHRIT